MTNHYFKKLKSYFSCGNCCLCVLVAGILVIVITYQISIRIADSTLFLETKNITLAETLDLYSYQNDPRAACFLEEVNRTAVNPRFDSRAIILKESDDYVVFVDRSRFGQVLPVPTMRFPRESKFSFYRILKNSKADNSLEVKTVFFGSIHTNLYGEWNGRRHRISISPDGKFIVMSARAVDSRTHGKFRNKEVLLIWEIGDNVVEKDIVDWNGNKIPIIIKTEEELEAEEKELEEQRIRSFKAISLDSTRIKLTWGPYFKTSRYYYVIIRCNVNGLSVESRNFNITPSTVPREHIFTRLRPNTTYEFQVCSVESNGVSTTIQTLSATTPP